MLYYNSKHLGLMCNHEGEFPTSIILLYSWSCVKEKFALILAALAGLFANNAKPRQGGLASSRHKSKQRHKMEGYCFLYIDYFADTPLRGEKVFRRHYRMRRKLVLKIVNVIWEFDNYFICKKNCTSTVGFCSLHKCAVAMRMLAYGAPGDIHEDYGRMAKSTTIACLYKFYRAVVEVFEPQYLRSPNAEDTARILSHNEARGFPGMLGNIDYMHWA